MREYHYQDLFLEKIKLSELRDNYFGHDKFIQKFGQRFVFFGTYYKDSSEGLGHILYGTYNKDEWFERIDSIIEQYGDIRVCYEKVDRLSGEKRVFDNLTKKDLVESLKDVPDDALILGTSSFPIRGYIFNRERNIITEI